MAWIKGRELKVVSLSPEQQRREGLIRYRQAIIERNGPDSMLLDNPIFKELDDNDDT